MTEAKEIFDQFRAVLDKQTGESTNEVLTAVVNLNAFVAVTLENDDVDAREVVAWLAENTIQCVDVQKEINDASDNNPH